MYIYILGTWITLVHCVCHFVACDAAFRSGGADCETNTVPSGSHAPIFVLPVVFLPCGTLGVTFLARRHHLPCARSRAPCLLATVHVFLSMSFQYCPIGSRIYIVFHTFSYIFSIFLLFHHISSCFHKW